MFAWYERNPPGELVTQVQHLREIGLSTSIFALQLLPPGCKGLLAAGLLAGVLAGMNALLPALTQTLASAFAPRSFGDPQADERTRLRRARWSLMAVGTAVLCIGLALQRVTARYGSVLELSSTLEQYTLGALLAGFVLVLARPRIEASGWLWSVPLSIVWVFALAWHGPRSVVVCFVFASAFLAAWIFLRVLPVITKVPSRVPLYGQTLALALGLALLVWVNRYGLVPIESPRRGDPEYSWLPLARAWYVPAGSVIAFVFGHLLARPAAPAHSASDEPTGTAPQSA
jgi:Na+/proline symporter